MNNNDQSLVLVARVTSVFGIKGWVKVFSYTDPPENVLEFERWLLYPSSGDGQSKNVSVPDYEQCQSVELTDGQRHGKKIIAQLNHCDTRNKAADYIRHDVFIQRKELPTLDQNDVYWVDLEGLKVVNTQAQELGHIESMMETGAHDVMVVRGEKNTGEAILIPYVPEYYVMGISWEDGTVLVDWELD